jgi:hypothetical protein
MNKLTLFAATAVATTALAVTVLAPAVAADLSVYPHHRHHYRHAYWGLPYHISYLHNYGPGLEPGRFAYYDGPANRCYQGSAAYIGQDRRRHPCS